MTDRFETMAELAEERERNAQAELAAMRQQQAERERVAALEKRVDSIRKRTEGLAGRGSAMIASVIENLDAEVIGDDYMDFTAAAEDAKVRALFELRALHAAEVEREAEAMTEIKITWIGDLQRLHLQPGEVLALTIDEYLTDQQAMQVRGILLRQFPEGTKAIVLSRGMKLLAVDAELAARVERLIDCDGG